MRILPVIPVLLLLAVLGCAGGSNDFSVVTSNYVSAIKSGVIRIKLRPVVDHDTMSKLTAVVTITNKVEMASILNEISFQDSPQLPKAMEHSGSHAECKMCIDFVNGNTFCLYVCFRDGATGSGVEYAIYPSASTDSSAHEEYLPGNYSLGRGYSVKLYGLLQTFIRDDGEGWYRRD